MKSQDFADEKFNFDKMIICVFEKTQKKGKMLVNGSFFFPSNVFKRFFFVGSLKVDIVC